MFIVRRAIAFFLLLVLALPLAAFAEAPAVIPRTILFDARGLQHARCVNLEIPGCDGSEFDVLILSRIHEEPIGGFACLGPLSREISLCGPASFPEERIDLVLGGFHLLRSSGIALRRTASEHFAREI